jgi:hypothetical protein
LATLQAAGKASNGGYGRELDYRAIVERHIGKHTGLRHSAKACLAGMTAMETGGKGVGGGEVQTYQASRTGKSGQRRKSCRFGQR